MSFLMRTLILLAQGLTFMTLFNHNYFLGGPSPNAATLGFGLKNINFFGGGDTNTQSVRSSLSHPLLISSPHFAVFLVCLFEMPSLDCTEPPAFLGPILSPFSLFFMSHIFSEVC